jgi:hypothetical protein
LADPLLARRLGAGARAYAEQRFNIARFAAEWEETFESVVSGALPPADERMQQPLLAGETDHA